MFNDIKELEKQVKEFQENILASTQLVKSMDSIARLIEMQQTNFDKESREMLNVIKLNVAKINERSDSLINTLGELLSEKSEEIARRNEFVLSKIKADSEEQKKYFGDKTNEFAKEIENLNVCLIKNFEIKFAELLKKVESIHNKLSLLLAGVGIIVFLTVISLFIK